MSAGPPPVRWILSIVVLATAGGSRAHAQVPGEVRWSLEESLGSYCIWYLADPDLARQMVPSGIVLTPAGTGSGLPPLLARTIQDEPRFAQWIPGSICIGAYRRVTADGRTLAQAKADRPVILATSSLAASGARGFPAASNYLIDFMTDQGALAHAADGIGVGMGGIKVITRTRVGADDPEVSIAIEGTQIIWSGHAIGDSGVGKTRSVSFGYGTGRSPGWLLELESAPASSRLLVGTLEIEGRNALARALKASPGRAIGPLESGGTAVLRFQKGTHP